MGGQVGSERVVVSAPMSYAGSAHRLWRGPALVRWLVMVPVIGVVWVGVTGWYLLFGILVVPYRLVRRGSRRRKRDGLRHREIIDAARTNQN
jgi:hypothetical protein